MAEKKYYWLQLKRDFFKRHDIRIIEGMPNGKDYALFYLKLLLESIDHKGELSFCDTFLYSEQMLAIITDTNIDFVRSAMKILTELGKVEIHDGETFYMTEIHSMMERFYAICGARGMTKDKSDALLAKHGYNSVREIDLDKFDEICREADAYREE